MLIAKDLIKIYGDEWQTNKFHALNGVTINIEEGEFVGIMGPSGSGKTTLLNILSGIDKPTSGKVEINSQNISDMNKDELALYRRRHIGYVFQNFYMLDSLTLKENIMLPLILDKKDSKYMEEKCREVMSTFDIFGFSNKYPNNLSGGQIQRGAISRAIINEPYIVFADEPTGNLDSKSAKDVMQCFEKMNKEKKCTILVVTHDAYTASYCDKIIFIKDGKVNMEIVKKHNRREFFENILDCLAILGGDRNDF